MTSKIKQLKDLQKYPSISFTKVFSEDVTGKQVYKRLKASKFAKYTKNSIHTISDRIRDGPIQVQKFSYAKCDSNLFKNYLTEANQLDNPTRKNCDKQIRNLFFIIQNNREILNLCR